MKNQSLKSMVINNAFDVVDVYFCCIVALEAFIIGLIANCGGHHEKCCRIMHYRSISGEIFYLSCQAGSAGGQY